MSYYYSDYDILFSGIVNDNFVMLVDSRKNIKIVNVGLFKRGAYQSESD